MKETPRVPKKILSSLQETLTDYYPEFEEEIKEWRSSNEISADKVEWKRFYSYTQLFDVCKDFINTYGEKDVMILTFSSASSAALAVQQSSLQRLCQVKNRTQASFFFVPGGETFTLKHSGRGACGIPDGETIDNSIMMTGGTVSGGTVSGGTVTAGTGHNYVTRC